MESAKLAVVVMLMAMLVLATHVQGFSVDEESLITNRGRALLGIGSLRSSQCPKACQYRCSKTQYRKPCLLYCNKCCSKCLCVPPGFYGNKQVCPCYNNWKTKRGTPKCP